MTRNDSTQLSSSGSRRGPGRLARIVSALVVSAAGLALLVHGAAFHTEVLWVTEEKPSVAPPPPPPDAFAPFFPGQGEPPPPLPAAPATIKELVPFVRSEPYLTELAALGGLEWLEDGRLGEKAVESACPT